VGFEHANQGLCPGDLIVVSLIAGHGSSPDD